MEEKEKAGRQREEAHQIASQRSILSRGDTALIEFLQLHFGSSQETKVDLSLGLGSLTFGLN